MSTWHGWPPQLQGNTTTQAETQTLFFYRDNDSWPGQAWNPGGTNIYWTPVAQNKTFKEKVQELRQDLKNYEEALDELQGLLSDMADLIRRRRPTTSENDTQGGMKT